VTRTNGFAFLVSIFAHAVFLSSSPAALTTDIKFGMAPEPERVGVELVKRAPKEVETLATEAVHRHDYEEPQQQEIKKEDLVIPKKAPSKRPTPTPPRQVEPQQKNNLSKDRVAPKVEGTNKEEGIHGDESLEPRKVNTGEGRPAGFVSASPEYYRNPPPAYPRESREKKEEGVVRLLVKIREDGDPEEVVVKVSSGFGSLDKAAENAVKRWRFKPATLLGQKVSSRVEIPIRFKLEEEK
jgi:protein TonB